MKKITFRPISVAAENLVDRPVPAKNVIPDWFKNVPSVENRELELDFFGRPNSTMKSCMPFFDTFISGYIQCTWQDIYVDTTNEEIDFKFPMRPELINYRNGISSYPKISGFHQDELVWFQQWFPQLPEGYSMLYTHPLNRYDLPFLSLTGIIDSDKYYYETLAQHPVFFKEGFKGIIPKGTPMFQMIPIKRDSWKSEFEEFNGKLQSRFLDVRKYFTGGYKKLFWQKKEYI